ncbi:MoaD/ThiS family protein [Amycolatopsis nigrescens]|uniref:MoaD/ThiS family protein n=1 Tax=Amycolatopsis nigrescens TaxID=381445 RepID=UPI0004761855|nr:MoaD/ThiS family protein [Amycolatopsis nigrescens]
MVTFTLAASLAGFLPERERAGMPAHCSLTIDANNWPEAVAQLRSRCERLGEHVFDGAGRLRPGFLVAVNDVVASRREGPGRLRPGDELFLFAQIAGG